MNEKTDEIKISKLLDYDINLAAQLYKGLGYNFNDFVNQIINWYHVYASLMRCNYSFLELDKLELNFKRRLIKNKEYTLKEIIKILNQHFCYDNRKILLELWLYKYWK